LKKQLPQARKNTKALRVYIVPDKIADVKAKRKKRAGAGTLNRIP